MRKVLILLIVFTCFKISAQETLSSNDKIFYTGKIWGFLKYYHPEIAEGKYNWDEELFKILPEINNVESKAEFSEVILNWIEKYGKIEICKKCSSHSNEKAFNKNFDLDWIVNENIFSKALISKLKFIEDNRHQGEKHYVSITHKNIGNVKITNEENYIDFDWQNQNLRLLSLFRYWNIVEYFFPYKYQTDTDWDTVLMKMIPKFLNSSSVLDYHLAMLELVVSVDDSHAILRTEKTDEFFGESFFPAKFKFIEDKAVITGFYDEDLMVEEDLQVGDIIISVNGLKIEELFEKRKRYISGSNISRKKLMTYYSLLNGSTDTIDVEIIREGRTINKNVKRYKADSFEISKQTKTKKHQVFEDNIGYINLGEVNVKEVMDIMKKLKDTQGLIIDLRNYPKGTFQAVARYISSKKSHFYRAIKPDLNYPGKFVWKAGYECGGNRKLKYKGKVVILVNEKTQSQAEFSTMCLQTGDNVTTVGSQTSGADGDISVINMVGGYKTAISGLGIFYPDGTETQRRGIKIDVEVKPTINGFLNGEDEVLEKALEIIKI